MKRDKTAKLRLLKDMSRIVYRRKSDLNSVQTSYQVQKLDQLRFQIH